MSPPADATAYLVAGYGLTWAAVLFYAWRVERRVLDGRRALDAMEDRDPAPEASAGSSDHGRTGDDDPEGEG